ncbi:MAG: HEAT repeat domain-containing protein, partial [Desulfobacterales bacterium]|nr:HEAT repeat domain-containing protein [Desulfobacterales bacterium]
YNEDQDVRWSAVKAMGRVVAKMADEDMESARVIMRRLMWNLNDESGGIGWGSPEAMAEILTCHDGLAKEYAHILISYARE